MKYIDQVVDNYSKNFENACTEIDTAINDLYTTIDTIFKENTFPEEQTTKWTTLLSNASVKAAELKLKIDEKYQQMTDKASYYDDIVAIANGKAGTEVKTGSTTSSDKLGLTENYSSIENAVAGMDTGEGYPIVYVNNITVKRTRETTDAAWGNGTKTNNTQSVTVKTKEELYALPPFTAL